MSKFAQLYDNLRDSARQHDEFVSGMDTSHPLQHIERLDMVTKVLIWLNKELLRELAKRDGVDVDIQRGAK